MVQVAGTDNHTMETLPVHSESEIQSTLTKQQLTHRQPYAAHDDVTDSRPELLDHDGDHHDLSKPKKSHGPFHYRKNSNATNDGTASHGTLTGSQESKEHDVHSDGHTRTGSHGLLGFLKRAGSQEVKHGDGDHHGHHHHHNSHGTRDKEIFGAEDADANHREHEGLFGFRDAENPQNLEKANSLFGYEDTEFERGQKGRDLFGDDDSNTLSSREKMDVMGPVETDESELQRTRHVFGDENAEDSDESGDQLDRVKKVHHHGHHGRH